MSLANHLKTGFATLFILLGIMGVLFPLPGKASLLDKAKKSKAPWHIEADHLKYESRKRVYHAVGNVRITSDGKVIKADRIRYSSITHKAVLDGSVYIKVGRDWLTGKHGEFDLRNETGFVENGVLFFYDQHIYVRGKILRKTGKDTYHVESGSVTSCDGVKPDWRFKFDDMDVTLSGRGKARHVSFNVSNIPILYTPYLSFPVKRERKSGFLFPSYSTSDLNGIGVEVPFYWAVNDHMDMTLYPHYYEDRGMMGGLEFRYKQSKENMGLLRFDYLSDHLSDDELEKFGYPRERKERWWWRSKSDFMLPGKVKGRLDLDVASDKYYLREFNTGSESWDKSDLDFRKMLGRGLDDDESVLARQSLLYLTRNWELTHIGFGLHYWDNLNRDLDETTLQQLPKIDINVAKRRLGKTPFFFDVDTEFMDYWRREGTKGQRVDLFPKISLPFKLKNYLNIEPSFGARGTIYYTDGDEKSDPDVSDDFSARGLVDCRLDLTSNVERIYDLNIGRLKGIKHTFRPEIRYEYIPNVDQEDFPAYDGVDRIPKYDRLTYGVSNFFIGKYWLSNGDYSFPEICRLKVFQSYDFEESPEIFHNEGKKPFSDFRFELDLKPCSYFSLSYDTGLSPYNAEWAGHELLARMSTPRGDSFNVDYRQRTGDLDQVNVYGSVRLTRYVSFSSRQHYSFLRDEFFEQTYSATLTKQCWSANVSYTDEADKQTWTFMINLRGIGAIGKETFGKLSGAK